MKSGSAADGWGRLSLTLASFMAEARRYPDRWTVAGEL
jgi:hypothetical protein